MDFTRIGDALTVGNLARQPVEGRVLQYDADFACYMVANIDRHVKTDFDSLIDVLQTKRVQVGASHINAFLTMGAKSGREAMATVKPYQENRDPNAPIKVRVRELRAMLSEYSSPTITAVASVHYEADDMMGIYQHEFIKRGDVELSIIMSGDKDLTMVMGLHADNVTGRIWRVTGYGKTTYKEVGNVKPKLVGEGTSFFWYQMIMGDRADNIPGLEKIDHNILDTLQPLKSGKARKAGAAACGESKAVLFLQTATSDAVAAQRVWKAYKAYYGHLAQERFVEQAYLLWMQRSYDPFDVMQFLDSVGLPMRLSHHQQKVLEEFRNEVCTTV